MNCESAQNSILQCEELRPKTWSREVRHHVKACAACYEFARSVKKLEKAWCDQPLPAQAKKPPRKFLKKIAHLEEPAPTIKVPHAKKPGARPWVRPVRWLSAVAAILIVCMGVAAFLMISPTPTLAAEVVDDLITLNAKLSNTDFEKRKELLVVDENLFQKRLEKTRLSPEERAHAEFLLAAARKLAESADFEEDEEIIAQLADKLLDRANYVEKKGIAKDAEKCNAGYRLFVTHAVNPLHNKMSIVDRLIEWNMHMAGADAKKRKELLDEHEATLAKDLKDANLPAEDHVMAEKLLEVGRRLASTSDPKHQAEAINDAADKLHARAETAKEKGKDKKSDRCGLAYGNFVKGFNPFFDAIKAMHPKGTPDGKKGWGHDFTRHQKQFEKMMWQRPPQIGRPEIQRKFEDHAKKGIGWPLPKGGFGGFKK